ncbi:MAG TPA: hypothetical protein P5268_00395 [Candidatus Marinimicrobia bacterium]|nr:hypothetical protein [Candidatus Neomarinimicrobiota bacterium]HRS51285.1 hypothetical protein [Candidatus Neomarinimicrobiota bacterium]HRU91477.1 hypothetical protein [Candidatus Neomarinimicrobiota bacterium]
MANYYTLNKNLSPRRTTPQPEKPPPSPEVKIDFSVADQRYEYIRNKLDDAMQSIGQCYSDRLTKELLRRLEKTILDFHTEVTALLEKFEKLETERNQPTMPAVTLEMETISTAVESQPSEQEKRIEERERKKADQAKESELTKKTESETKRRFFNRKK